MEELHNTVIQMRKAVIKLVDEFGYSASELVSRTFEHDIESVYGRRLLKEKEKEKK